MNTWGNSDEGGSLRPRHLGTSLFSHTTISVFLQLLRYVFSLKNICAVLFATLCLQVVLPHGVRSVFCEVCLSLVVVAALASVEWQLRPG